MPAPIEAVVDPNGSRLPLSSTSPVALRSSPKIALRDLAAPRAHQPGKADDLTRANLKVHIAKEPRRGEITDPQDDFARLARDMLRESIRLTLRPIII